ncbi:MAG: DUF896 domain-containing protein [Lactobacillales bacterium]|jgi:uncharacterized protein YnzC (UPF0291/DUF896 family)|nr:DUF896 domain-containing protein [Lactobacillales bacterium]
MVTEKMIARINQLARKQKSEDLTAEERAEQQRLRRSYLDAIKENLRHHIEGIKVVNEEGNDITPEKLTDKSKY